jgi:glycosyltransferase involved in cell wall biosynthesis
MQPLVSIIVPCYNQQQFVAECLKSILAQTYTHWQCIVINDGSTDDTEAVVKHTIRGDDRFTYLYQPNAGVSAARNVGLARATGDYIAFLDGDDWWHPEFLEKMMALATPHGLVVCNTEVQWPNGRTTRLLNSPKRDDFTFTTFLQNWDASFTPAIHSALISKTLVGSFTFVEGLHGWEELVLWLHILKQPVTVNLEQEVLSYYRKHATSNTNQQNGLSHLHPTILYINNWLPPQHQELWLKKTLNFYSSQLYYYQKEAAKYPGTVGEKVNNAIIKLKKIFS